MINNSRFGMNDNSLWPSSSFGLFYFDNRCGHRYQIAYVEKPSRSYYQRKNFAMLFEIHKIISDSCRRKLEE